MWRSFLAEAMLKRNFVSFRKTKYSLKDVKLLTLFRMVLSGASHISQNNKTWHRYTLPKEDQKVYINHPVISDKISSFYWKLVIFVILGNTNKNSILVCFFLIHLTFIKSLNVALINMVVILVILSKSATTGLLK